MASKNGNGKLRKDQTDHYGRIKNGGGGGGATIDDFVDSSDIKFSTSNDSKIKAELTDSVKEVINNSIVVNDITDTETINPVEVQTPEGEKLGFSLKNEIVNKIENSLQTPKDSLTELELVGIDTNKEQKRITIGRNLSVDNNELNARDVTIDDFVDSETIEFKTDGSTGKVKANVIGGLSNYILELSGASGTLTDEQVARIRQDPNTVIVKHGEQFLHCVAFSRYNCFTINASIEPVQLRIYSIFFDLPEKTWTYTYKEK